MAKREGSSGLAGGLFGIVVFIIGVALLLLAFKFAKDMFERAPIQRFQGKDGVLDLGAVVPELIGIVVQILLLLVMSIVGGMIANRGIRLYADSRVVRSVKE